MMKKVQIDEAAAHQYFSAHCFNLAWDLIEKSVRTAQEDRLMIALNQASIYHWMQRADCNAKSMSIGYWQASRIYALLGDVAMARSQGEVCLSYSTELDPFYLGYAFEALARAEWKGHSFDKAREYLALAREQMERVGRKADRDLLSRDLLELAIGLSV